MDKKDLHIVFGFTGKATLSQTKFANPQESEILALTDPLAEGPLCDLQQPDRIQNRKRWLNKTFGSWENEDGIHFVDENLSQLQTLTDTIDHYRKVYLWLGDDVDEKLNMARLAYHIRNTEVPVLKVDFSKAQFENAVGKIITVHSLRLVNYEKLRDIDWQFVELGAEDRSALARLWEHTQSEESIFRNFNKEGELISGDESLYDHFLLSRCTDSPQISSRIVGGALCDLWDEYTLGGVGDSFLFYRLNELEKMGKVKITNRDTDRPRQIFDVRKCV